MNQYELDDEARTTLSTEEIEELEKALVDPVFEDNNDISAWAEEEVAFTVRAGVFCGDEAMNFNPQQYLHRSECVKAISAYLLMDTKPTYFFPGGSYIEYIPYEESIDPSSTNPDLKTEHGDNFNFYSETDTDLENSITPKWASVTHNTVSGVALNLLLQNTGEGGRAYIYNKMGETIGYNSNRTTGRQRIKYMSYHTDSIETQGGNYYAHFYNPSTGESYNGSKSLTAYIFFSNHYYNAYTNYINGNRYAGYTELGMSIHYLEDLNNPYHASNKTTSNSNHKAYETWANNVVANCSTSMTYSSYRFIYDSRFIDMANSFAGVAKKSYGICSMYNVVNSATILAARNATVENLTRTERAVCGLLNRFYYNARLN